MLKIDFPGFLNSGYQEIRYPAGEFQIRLMPQIISDVESTNYIRIDARISCVADLMTLLLLNDTIRAVNPTAKRVLHIPYLPYSRGDRRFVPGDCHGLAVFGQLIGLAQFDEIVTLDVHNLERALMFVPKLVNIYPQSLIRNAIVKFAESTGWEKGKYAPITLLFPDAGAAKRYHVPSLLPSGIAIETLYAAKIRNKENGKLEGFEVPEKENFHFGTNSILVIDDICDGGGTFLGIASALRALGLEFELGLYVTHGIFSKGLAELQKQFRFISSTDSIRGTSCLNPDSSFKAIQDPTNLRQGYPDHAHHI